MHAYVVAAIRPTILVLMGASLFLLLIACSNIANLMMVRLSLRERELAVRTSLGGSWWQLARQTLTEALLVAGSGTLLGIGLGEPGRSVFYTPQLYKLISIYFSSAPAQ